MSDLRGLASDIGRALQPADVPPAAVGVVQRVSLTGNNGEAQVMFGFAPDLIPIDIAAWGDQFLAAARSNSAALVGRRIFAAFIDGQPVILTTLGV